MTPQSRRPYVRTAPIPLAPGQRPVLDWLPVNRGCYAAFREWLYRSAFSPAAMYLYGLAARLVFSLIDKPYWSIDLASDLNTVRDYVCVQYASDGTRQTYFKGIAKLEQYLRLRAHQPRPEKAINWAHYAAGLPADLLADLQAYLAQRRRAWLPERQSAASIDLVSHLTGPLRGLAAQATLAEVTDLTPARWYAYLDARLAAGIQAKTLNGELRGVQQFLMFLAEQGRPVCQRMLRVEPLAENKPVPRDVPPEQLRQLLTIVEADTHAAHGGVRRTALLDHAWVLLMLHSGLRTGEVRRLRLGDIDWERRQVRIEQSKGLKDRIVCVSAATIVALHAYLEVRGPAEALPDHVFIYRHAALSESYCGQRLLKYYGKRSGFRITPHQLRHSCATLLLNAGAPILTVQTILGHRHIDTTLGYARLYDGTVAADYYRAMAQIERQMALPEDAQAEPPSSGQLLALVDALRSGTLNESQQETVCALRAGITALAERAAAAVDTDRPIA